MPNTLFPLGDRPFAARSFLSEWRIEAEIFLRTPAAMEPEGETGNRRAKRIETGRLPKWRRVKTRSGIPARGASIDGTARSDKVSRGRPTENGFFDPSPSNRRVRGAPRPLGPKTSGGADSDGENPGSVGTGKVKVSIRPNDFS